MVFYWIKKNGLKQFQWYNNQDFRDNVGEDETFLTGLISALNSVAEIYLEHSKIRFISFSNHEVFIQTTKIGDFLVLITKRGISVDIVTEFFDLVRQSFWKYDAGIDHVNSTQETKIKKKFRPIIRRLAKKYQVPPSNITEKINRMDKSDEDSSRSLKKIKEKSSMFNRAMGEDAGRPSMSLYGDRQETKNEMKKIVKNLHKMQSKMHAYEYISRNVGHALNNTFTSILGNIELELMDKEEMGEDAESLEIIKKNVQKATALTTQLMNLARSLNYSEKISLADLKEMIQKPKKPKMNIEKKGKIRKGQGRILIMDDEKSLLKTIGKLLKKLGYEVEKASRGESALKIYKQHLVKNKKIDLVILDLVVEDGMGGVQTLTKLKEMDPNVMAVVSSGTMENTVMKNYQEYGFVESIQKPYNISDLSQLVKKVMKKRRKLFTLINDMK